MLVLGAVLASAACTPASPAREERTAPATAHEDHPAPRDEAPAPAPIAHAPPAVLVTGDVAHDSVTPVVQNHDHTPVSLAGALNLEREGANGFAPHAAKGLSLRAACGAQAAACIDLVPGAELRPPPWQGPRGRTQCDEGATIEAPPGRYRFVAATCGGGASIAGEPFELD